MRHQAGPRVACGLFCVCLVAAGCGEEKRSPTPSDVDAIMAAVSEIVFQCRSVERGLLAGADERALRRDVDTLAEAAKEVDPDARFRPPESPLRRKTTLRDQTELAVERLGEKGCSREQAERLREALGD
jgi:hypothetical protein